MIAGPVVSMIPYDSLLGDLPEVRLPGVADGNQHVWHLYVLRVPRRDAVLAELHSAAMTPTLVPG